MALNGILKRNMAPRLSQRELAELQRRLGVNVTETKQVKRRNERKEYRRSITGEDSVSWIDFPVGRTVVLREEDGKVWEVSVDLPA